MITNLAYWVMAMILLASNTFAQVGLEQYCYLKHSNKMEPVSILNYESRKNLYTEARYNYEAPNTFSIYLGKAFSNYAKSNDKIKYSIMPMAGALVGNLKGGSVAVNATGEFKKLFCSTQSQYTWTRHERKEDFFFAWSELGYYPRERVFVGLSTQQTYMPLDKTWLLESGIVIGFDLGKWTIPIYSFNMLNDSRYFVVGIIFHSEIVKKNK